MDSYFTLSFLFDYYFIFFEHFLLFLYIFIINFRNQIYKFISNILQIRLIIKMKERTNDEIYRMEKLGKLTMRNFSSVSKQKKKSKKAIKKKSRRLFMKNIRKTKSTSQLIKNFDSQYQYSKIIRCSFDKKNQKTAQKDFSTQQNVAQVQKISIDFFQYLSLFDKWCEIRIFYEFRIWAWWTW